MKNLHFDLKVCILCIVVPYYHPYLAISENQINDRTVWQLRRITTFVQTIAYIKSAIKADGCASAETESNWMAVSMNRHFTIIHRQCSSDPDGSGQSQLHLRSLYHPDNSAMPEQWTSGYFAYQNGNAFTRPAIATRALGLKLQLLFRRLAMQWSNGAYQVQCAFTIPICRLASQCG